MGLAGLTAVFGMGTGVTPPVWSPEKRPAGGQAGRARDSDGVAHDHRGILASGGARGAPDPYCDHRPIASAPPWRGAPIGVVKLLGC